MDLIQKINNSITYSCHGQTFVFVQILSIYKHTYLAECIYTL